MNHKRPASDVNISQQSSEVVGECRTNIAITIRLDVSKTSNMSVTGCWSSMILVIGIVMSASCLAVVSKISILMDMEAMFTWSEARQIQFECCITRG